MNKNNLGTTQKQIVRYILVGGSSALIDVGLFQFLVHIMGAPVVPANISSLIVSTVYNFILNRNATFKSTSNPLRSIVLYFVLLAFNMWFTSTVIAILVEKGLSSLIAKLLTIICVTLWNFVLYRKIVFPPGN